MNKPEQWWKKKGIPKHLIGPKGLPIISQEALKKMPYKELEKSLKEKECEEVLKATSLINYFCKKYPYPYWDMMVDVLGELDSFVINEVMED